MVISLRRLSPEARVITVMQKPKKMTARRSSDIVGLSFPANNEGANYAELHYAVNRQGAILQHLFREHLCLVGESAKLIINFLC
jgi:hypothetical protein